MPVLPLAPGTAGDAPDPFWEVSGLRGIAAPLMADFAGGRGAGRLVSSI